jgi:hypothetical protein
VLRYSQPQIRKCKTTFFVVSSKLQIREVVHTCFLSPGTNQGRNSPNFSLLARIRCYHFYPFGSLLGGVSHASGTGLLEHKRQNESEVNISLCTKMSIICVSIHSTQKHLKRQIVHSQTAGAPVRPCLTA